MNASRRSLSLFLREVKKEHEEGTDRSLRGGGSFYSGAEEKAYSHVARTACVSIEKHQMSISRGVGGGIKMCLCLQQGWSGGGSTLVYLAACVTTPLLCRDVTFFTLTCCCKEAPVKTVLLILIWPSLGWMMYDKLQHAVCNSRRLSVSLVSSCPVSNFQRT